MGKRGYPYTIIIWIQNATALLCSAARNASLNAQAERGIAPEHICGSEINSFVTAIKALADQVVRAHKCNDAGTFNNPPLRYSLHCASVKRKQQQEDEFKDKNGKKKNRWEDDGNADHGKHFGCLVLVDPNRAPNLRVNCLPLIQAGNRDGRPCYPFMTQGLTCTNHTTCTYLHVLNHLRGVEDRTPLLDWIASEPTLAWAPGKKPSWSLSQGSSRSTPGHCSAPPQRHKPPPQQRGNAAPPPPAQSGAQQQPAARGGQQQRSTPPAPVTPAAAAPPASGSPVSWALISASTRYTRKNRNSSVKKPLVSQMFVICTLSPRSSPKWSSPCSSQVFWVRLIRSGSAKLSKALSRS
jgi:hypothetical protein